MNLIYIYSFTSIIRSYGFLYEIRTGVSDLFPALKGGVPVDGGDPGLHLLGSGIFNI
jgi:hypothetical protein